MMDEGPDTAPIDRHLPSQRVCPQCGRLLEREDPRIPVRCFCGWVWE